MYYTEEQVRNALDVCGLRIDSSTLNTFITHCPFHGNSGSPAFNVARNGEGFNCHNPSCKAHGNLVQLVQAVTKKNYWSARRLIGDETHLLTSVQSKVYDNLNTEPGFKEYDQGDLDRLQEALYATPEAVQYLHGRGFTDTTLKYFQVGYSATQGMVVTPMHDIKGRPIGYIGRSIHGKVFKNSLGLPKAETLFNIHRARATGAEAVIIVESCFDVMRLHQAGYPNSVAVLGGAFNSVLASQIGRTFSTVINATDYDDKSVHKGKNPGEDLGRSIEHYMSDKMIMWAHCGGPTRFPEGVKDISDMDDTLIRQCIKHAEYSFEYADSVV